MYDGAHWHWCSHGKVPHGMPNQLRKGLPPLPKHMQGLPISDKGYPVPYFVQKVNGVWDFRVMDPEKFLKAVKFHRCWICGGPMGNHKAFVGGPLATVNRTSGEPPSHYDCAHFAVEACPFLALPKVQRREHGLPDGMAPAGGKMLAHNPGVTCIWVTDNYTVKPDPPSGVLFRMGAPSKVEYYCQGRPATRGEVEGSLGLSLAQMDKHVGAMDQNQRAEVAAMILLAQQYWPAA